MPDATSYANSAAASISMLFIVVAVIFGVIQKHLGSRMNEVIKAIVAIVLLVVMFIIGMKFPICTTKTAWIYIVMAYLFLASVMPMWLLMQPRDYMTTFMLLGMIIGAVVGVIVAHPSMQLNAFSGFNVGGSSLFPTLFVTIACGAVSVSTVWYLPEHPPRRSAAKKTCLWSAMVPWSWNPYSVSSP